MHSRRSRHTFLHAPSCGLIVLLLKYAYLRDSYALLAPFPPAFPSAMRRHLPRWSLPGPSHAQESFAVRVETLVRSSLTSWPDVFLDRQIADRRKHLCSCRDRALGPGPGVRPGNLGD